MAKVSDHPAAIALSCVALLLLVIYVAVLPARWFWVGKTYSTFVRHRQEFLEQMDEMDAQLRALPEEFVSKEQLRHWEALCERMRAYGDLPPRRTLLNIRTVNPLIFPLTKGTKSGGEFKGPLVQDGTEYLMIRRALEWIEAIDNGEEFARKTAAGELRMSLLTVTESNVPGASKGDNAALRELASQLDTLQEKANSPDFTSEYLRIAREAGQHLSTIASAHFDGEDFADEFLHTRKGGQIWGIVYDDVFDHKAVAGADTIDSLPIADPGHWFLGHKRWIPGVGAQGLHIPEQVAMWNAIRFISSNECDTSHPWFRNAVKHKKRKKYAWMFEGMGDTMAGSRIGARLAS
ncbi:hypothetical protein [Corynebacterium aquilae]|uniref:hypothetical protein n=1 Tax=Corynebacterium aquilae TaxID=203263 RepID=UPI0012EDC0F3|nr:hypothetical protein [Corynebacterium aquilae]